jgi:hypothetical protein
VSGEKFDPGNNYRAFAGEVMDATGMYFSNMLERRAIGS